MVIHRKSIGMIWHSRIHSFSAAGNHAVAFTDLVIQHLAAQPENKNVTFTHAYPGSVKTEIGVNLPFYIRLPFKAFMAVRAGVTPEECAEYMVHGILGTENGWRCIDEKGETVRNKKESSTESAEKVWEHTSQIISRTN